MSLIHLRALRAALVLLFSVTTGHAAAAQADRDGDREMREANRRAYTLERAGASGVIPPTAAFDRWREIRALPLAQADQGWRPLGPSGLWINQESFGGVYGAEMKSGRVNAIAFSPLDSRHVVIGTMGGVWRTTNGGNSWSSTFDQQCTLTLGDVLIDPLTPTIVYAATGDGNGREQTGCGVIRSTDGGQTWTPPTNSPLVGTYIYQIALDRRTAGSAVATTLVAATTGGLFVSINSGATWTQRVSGTATAVIADPTRVGVFYASVSTPGVFPRTTMWRSVDGGITWSALPTPLPSGTLNARMELAMSPAAPGQVFVFAGDFSSRLPIGLWRWNDNLASWTRLNASGVTTSTDPYPYTLGMQAEYDLVLAVDPRDANRIWIAGVGAYFSSDGGANFRITAPNVHVDWHALAFDPTDPNIMAAGTDGGVYFSYDGGRTFRAKNQGLAITQVYQGLSVHPSGLWVYAGLQDNNAIYYTGSNIWGNLSLLGDGGYTAVNSTDPSTVWVTHAFNNFVMRQARGVKEADRSNGILPNDRGGIPRPIVMDPLQPTTLYFGTQRLYRTIDDGALWTALTGDLTRGGGYITTVAVAPSDPRVIWVGTSDGVLAFSTDRGATWQQLAFAIPRFFTRLYINPVNPQHVIATASTLGAPKMTQTLDGGQSFNSSIGGALPDVSVHAVVPVPNSQVLLAATDFGVLQSTNGGGTWTQGPPGMPMSIVKDLVYMPTTGTVYAATFGRGVFAYRPGVTAPVLRGDVDRDGRLSAQDALLVQQALVGLELPGGRQAFPDGDANCDGQLSMADAVFILRSAVGLPTTGVCAGTMARPAGGRSMDDAFARRFIQGMGPIG